MHPLDLSIIVIYLIVMGLVGWWVAKKASRSAESYFLAGKSLPWWVIGVALALYLIEFVADKIPLIDSTWDVIHTFIRIPAGAALAVAAFGDYDKGVQAVAFLLGGGLALSSHGTKAATRAVINTTPEPVTNMIASLVEDVVAVGSMLLAAFLPIVLIVVVVVGLVISMVVLPRTVRYFGRIAGKMRGQSPLEKARKSD